MALTQTQVSQLYVAIFNRASEGEGNKFWQTSQTTADAANDMLATTDAKAYFGANIDSNQDFIEHIYSTTLNKTYAQDKDGIDFWVNALNSGMSRGEVVASLVAAVADYANSKDPATKAAYDQFNNRVEVSNYMANTVEKAPEDYKTSTEFATSGTTGLVVTDNTSTVTTAKNSVIALTIDGETFTLTTGSEKITGTDANDLFIGVVSSLSSEKTLDAADVIDGGAGTDTMNVNLKGSFAGLGTDGSIKNVENMNLTNDSTIDRTFNAKNITGVEKYTLTSAKGISISNLAAADIEVAANGLQSDYSVGFSSDLDLTGSSDAMTLSFDGVGAAAVKNSSGVVTTNQNNVAVTMANIEDLTLKTSGEASFVNLAAVDATSYTVSGSADLTISAVKDGITSIDASELSGNFKIDTTNVSGADLTTITSGSGDDEITIDAADTTPNASINGGAGTDTVVVKAGSASTVQYAMSNVETVEFENANAITFSATNVSDLETVQVNALTGGAAVSVVNLGSRDITVQTEGATVTGQDISVDNSGTATVNFNVTEKEAKDGKASTTAGAVTVAGNVTLSNAATAVINVNDYAAVTATVDATKATDLTLNIASAKNSATTPAEQTSFSGILKAAAATSATITAEGTLNLTAGSDLSAVETLNLTTTGAADISNANLESAATVIVGGTAKTSALTIGDIGTDGTTAVDYNVSVEATGLKAGLTTGAIASQQNVTVDVSGVTGNVSLASSSGIVGQNVTITANEAAGIVLIDDITANTAGKGTATVNATGATKAVTVGAIAGFATIAINAADALNNVTVGNMTADDITLNVGNTLGTVTTGTITVKDSFTYTAALKGAMDDSTNTSVSPIVPVAMDIKIADAATSTTVTLNGNLGDDKFDITGGNSGAKDATIIVKGDLGIGTNDVSIGSTISGIGKLTVDLTKLAASGTTTVDITGTANNDTIKLSKDADIAETIVFAAVASNGEDTITGFDAGTGGDVLKVSTLQALTTNGTKSVLQGIASSTAKVDVTANAVTTNGNGVILIKDQAATDWSDVGTVIGSALTVDGTATNNGLFVILIDNGTDTRVYNYADTTDGFAAADDLTLVATVTGVQTDNGTSAVFDAGNFA